MKMLKDPKLLAALLLSLLGAFAMPGCEEGAFEEAGEEIDEAGDDMDDAVEDAGDEIEDAADDIDDEIDDRN
jgi:hypothetical protein